MSARYEKGSIVLTSNKHVRDWPAIFAGDEILTTAILEATGCGNWARYSGHQSAPPPHPNPEGLVNGFL